MGWKCGKAFIFSLIIRIPIDIYQVLTKGDKQILSTQNTNIYGDMYNKFGKSIPELKKTIDKGKFRLSILLEHSHYQSLQVISGKTGARKKKIYKEKKLIDLSHIVNKNMSKKKKVQKRRIKRRIKKKNKKKTKKSK